MTVLGIATRAEEQTDLAALRKGLDADFASAVLPIGVELNTIQTNQADILAAISALASQVTALQGSISTMSATLESQIQAATAAIQADLAGLATDLTSIASQIAALQAGQTVGSTVTQADVDALNAVKNAADAARATADAMANPPPPLTP